MNTIKPYLIFSVDRDDRTDDENRTAQRLIEQVLAMSNTPYKTVRGVYRGGSAYACDGGGGMKAYYLITAWQGVNPRMDFANMSELQEVLEDLKLDFTEVMEDTKSVFHVYDDGTDGLFQVMCRICLSFDLPGFEHHDETPVKVTVTDKGIETTSIRG